MSVNLEGVQAWRCGPAVMVVTLEGVEAGKESALVEWRSCWVKVNTSNGGIAQVKYLC